MKKMKLLIGFVLMTVFVGCSPRFSFIKADYDGQRRPTQVGYGSSGYGSSGYGSSGYGHTNDRYRGYGYKGFGHSRYGYGRYDYRGYRSRY